MGKYTAKLRPVTARAILAYLHAKAKPREGGVIPALWLPGGGEKGDLMRLMGWNGRSHSLYIKPSASFGTLRR